MIRQDYYATMAFGKDISGEKGQNMISDKTQIPTLYCLSTGPGDPELMTLKAVRIAGECPVIALSVDKTGRDRNHYTETDAGRLRKNCVAYQIALQAVPDMEEKEFLYLSMPMSKDKEFLKRSHEEAAEAVVNQLKQGRSVAWLTLGDATVYATSGYVAPLVEAAGWRVEFVSGVPSFCAAAARLGRPLVSGSQQLHVLPSSYHIEDALSLPGTKVLMKAGSCMGQIKQVLEEQKLTAQGVQRCGMEGETIYPDTRSLDENAGYYTVVIVNDGTNSNSSNAV